MKKTLIMMILSVSVFVCSIAGCGKDEEAAAEKTVSENTETSETVEEVCDGCQKQKECSTYTVDGKEYIALLPLAEDGSEEDGDVYIYRYVETEDGEPTLENIEDDDEYEAAADAFDEWLDEQEFEELEIEE